MKSLGKTGSGKISAFIPKYIFFISIDLKRISRCKLALIFTSADHRKFLGWFGSEEARL